jgi:2-polyprenyl-6-methoxyphenol hydroxylase-like FAD-dependent oxidoreductase
VTAKDRRSAIVVGAGPGGLAAAIALRRVGFEVRVYERDAQPGVGGAGLNVAPNAMRALQRLDLADALVRDAGPPPLGAEIRTADGRVLMRIDLPAITAQLGEPSLAIRRGLLQDVLMSALPSGVVRTGRACTGVRHDETAAMVEFADGSSDSADVVVGADGLRSVVRGAIGTGRVRYTGSTSWRTLVPATKVPSIARRSGFEAWGGGDRFGMGHLGEHVYCFATAPTPEGTAAPDGERAALMAIFADWAPPVPELVAAFDDHALIRTDINELVDVERWAAGRLVVIGDAAHAMTPDLGQGACQALEDAVFLAAALAGADDVPEAMRSFEQTRRSRPERIARQARGISRLVQSTNPVAGFVRRLTGLTPTRAMTRRYVKLADVRLPVLAER